MTALDFRPATITVSGYPPITAVLGLFDGHAIATAVHTGEIFQLRARQEDGGKSKHLRCGYCRRRTLRATLGGSELGIAGLCPACVDAFTALCVKRHGRLPGPTEFLCVGCKLLRRHPADRLPPDRGHGWKRYRCRPCRRRQIRRAVQRLRARRRRR